jgi:Tol biopolymer transport system component
MTARGQYFYRVQTNTQDVYLVDIDPLGQVAPGPPRRISSAIVGGHIGPGWSPDGGWISYVSASGNTALDRDANTLTIRDVHTGQTRDVAVRLSSLGVAAPQWSPDGRSVLVRGRDLQNRSGRFRVDVATGEATPVVLWNESRATEYGRFVWSPDGRGVFYLHDPRGIVVRDLATERETTIVPNARSSLGAFVISPDGTSLAFTTTTGEGPRTTMWVRTANAPAQRVFEAHGLERLVLQDWTPDGRAVLVTRFTQGSAEAHRVWKITIPDGHAYDLGVSVASNTQANRVVLRPDGRQLAYTAGVVTWETWVMEGFLPVP